MDKYEYKIKEEDIKELIKMQEFGEAAEVADTVDWRRVKSVKMLCMVSDIYKKMRRYEDSRDMLLLAYDRHPGGRTIVYSLCELAIKMGDLGQALEYCKEFIQIAPKDPGRYILQYKLYEAQEVGLEECITVLEELKKRDYREKWAYELALLYHKVGMESKCVEECDELIVWFGEGKYVIKAMELKMQHQPLTLQQQEKYDNRFKKPEPVQELVAVEEVQTSVDIDAAATIRIPADEIDIQVKTMGLSQCDTINLQAEVAAGLKEYLERNELQENEGISFEDTNTAEFMMGVMDTSQIISLQKDTEKAPAEEEISDEMEEVSEEVILEESAEEVSEEAILEENAEEAFDENAQEALVEAAPETDPEEAEENSDTVEAVEEELVEESVEEVAEAVSQKPEELDWQAQEMAKVLSVEGDGQISFVVPESVALEKQITGQMNFNDILLEWERMKLELEEKRKENVRQMVLKNTGSMFTDFEASVRDGLLEQLENGKTMEEILPQAENLEWKVDEQDIETQTGDDFEDIEMKEESVEEEIGEAVEDFEELEEITEEVSESEDTEDFPEAEDEMEALEELVEVEEADEVVEAAEEETVEVAEKADSVTESEDTVGEGEDLEEAGESEELSETESVEAVKELEETEEIEEQAEEAIDVVEEFEENEASEDAEDANKEKASGRAFTKEEKELFAPYIQGRESKNQLLQAMDNISLAAYTGNVVITGREGLDTIGLARSLIKNIQQEDKNFSGKVAKISGNSLNKRNVAEIVEGLVNGAIIIQRAGDINEATAKSLYKVLQQETRGIIVVLEGTKRAINTFFEKYSILEPCFNARIDMEALSNESLVSFAKKYAREQECSIDEFGMLALHRTISDRQTSDHAVTIMEVKEIMDNAIESANRKSLGHFFSILAAKRYDEEDMIIIREKDFM